MDFNLRVVYVPTKKYANHDKLRIHIHQYMDQLKQQIELCDLRKVNIILLNDKKAKNESYPDIEELIFQIHAIYEPNNLQYDTCFAYQEFLRKWKKLFFPKPSPILIMHETSSFISSRRACHIANAYTNVAFGALPHDGTFHQYASLPNTGYVDFFHDTRNMKIKYSHLELALSYDNIRNIFVNINSSPREIFFDLCNPPLVFRVEEKQGKDSETYFINHRTMTIKSDIDLDVFGRSNVIRVSLSDTASADDIISKIRFQCSEKPVHFAYIVSIVKSVPSNVSLKLPHFGCTYLLTAILKRNFTMAAQTTDIACSISELQRLCTENATCLEKALTLVLTAVDIGKVINYWHAIEDQYRYYLKNTDEINYAQYVIPEKCRMIRRITITPTRKILWAPEIMFGNRILRNFDQEYTLRVCFRDDNNSRLNFIAAFADEHIFDITIQHPLITGITIGSRRYDFLAWSNSQMREHGIWMYAKDTKGNTVEQIREWMGNFSHIHSVSKCMSRMGQCFSQTEDTVSVPLDESHVRTEDDIERGFDNANFKPYCFSDGVGKISTKLANEVHEALGHDKLCSAFQIRYGGYKGMLVVDPTLKDADIVFRKSMKKFDSPQSIRLEIAKTSAPIRLQLNRPFIAILNDMGVPNRVFLRLQEEVLKNLTDILFEEKKAAVFLESNTPNKLFDYRELSRSGVYLTSEPFFRSLLLASHRVYVAKIKVKANIPIDPSEARNMLGVLDETGLLSEGQVFIQYTKDILCGETTKDTVILNRTVLVTKHPCLLPGDVRKFQAVDIPELRHIIDCIVFSQKGSRPHPNEMAGSDMDGDEYAVLWKDDVIFVRPNEKPGVFKSASEKYMEHIDEIDMIECLIRYIKNDQLGTIANAHLAHADESSIFSEHCIKIAKKFSLAVDFAKSGVSEHLDHHERPKRFPDFMEKIYKETYKSKKALGCMYRVVRDYESENENASITYQGIQVDDDLKYPGWEKYKEDAIRSRNKFNSLLKTIFRNYGIQHEGEAYSGSFINLHSRFQERRDRCEIEKVVAKCIERLTKSFLEEFLEEFKLLSNVTEVDVQMLQKASAWYVVTYSDEHATFLSFPWTVSKYLALIKAKKDTVLPQHISPIVEKMDQQIEICESKFLLPPLSEVADVEFRKRDFANPNAMQLALRVLILWAQDEEIIKKPGLKAIGFLFENTFIDLFFHVAEFLLYAVKKGGRIPPVKGRRYSSASMCLDFLRFCIALRYYSKFEVKTVVPFPIYKYTQLSKKAVVAYHGFAVLGKFSNLYFDPVGVEDRIEMRPVHIESKIFPHVPVHPDMLENARSALLKYSKVQDLTLREISLTKKVVVNAVGSEQSLKTLKNILRKKNSQLRNLFTTGLL